MTSDLVGWDEKSVGRRCGTIEYSELEIAAIRRKTNMQIFIKRIQGRNQEFVQGGLKFFIFPVGDQHPLGPEINRFHCPPPEYAPEEIVGRNALRNENTK